MGRRAKPDNDYETERPTEPFVGESSYNRQFINFGAMPRPNKKDMTSFKAYPHQFDSFSTYN